jgi:hypothetical protein
VSDFEIIREKLNQAVDVLKEKQIDLWITFVRETTQVRDPCLDLLLGFDLTWQSALMISRTGERVAIVGRFDADNVERVNGYTTVLGYRVRQSPCLGSGGHRGIAGTQVSDGGGTYQVRCPGYAGYFPARELDDSTWVDGTGDSPVVP